MIFKLLDAYEEEIRNENSFFKKILEMNIKKKILVIIVLLFAIGILPLLLVVRNNLVSVIYMVLYVIIVFVINEFQYRDRKRNYIDNMSEYNKRLDKLKKLLMKQEFSACSDKKINALIIKIHTYLDGIDNKNKEKKQSNNRFNSNFVIPITTFLLGTVAAELAPVEIAGYGIVILLFVFYIRFIGSSIIEMGKSIFETTPVKMQYLLDELQDLYDRDFIE